MKVLWMSNVPFSYEKIRTTGSWVQPLAEMLSHKIEVVNVTKSYGKGEKKEIIGNIVQYSVVSRHTLWASKSFCKKIQSIIEFEKPDIVHIWGTESLWASIAKQGYVHCPYVLDIQGLLFSICDYYYGDLSFSDILKSIYLKEIILPWRTLFGKKILMKRKGKKECNCLSSIQNISYQSKWVLSQLEGICHNSNFFHTRIMLRPSFYQCEKWQCPNNPKGPVIYTSASGAIPYKGIDVAFKVVSELIKEYPGIELRVAGEMRIGNILIDGYSKYLGKLIKDLDIENNVLFLGPIDEGQIVCELLKANATLIPSFIESYCLALAESMIVGTPTVCAFSGAMPEFAIDGKEALFYNPSDYRQAAFLLDKLFQDESLSKKISNSGRERRLLENNPQQVINTQMEIYKQVIYEGSN